MLIILNTILLGVACVLLLVMLFKKSENGLGSIERKVEELEKSLLRIENALREDFRINREENDKIARENISELKLSMDQTIKYQTDKLESLINKIEEKNKDLRDVIEKSFKIFAENFDKNVKSFNDLQREKFAQLEEKQTKLVDTTEKRLDQMRETVEEKLQKTLNDRLTQSFAMVGTQLESVQKGLGEMQNIASDVGGLKKVLSNVKLRGNVGEVQLAMLLEQILAPTQYDAFVRTLASY